MELLFLILAVTACNFVNSQTFSPIFHRTLSKECAAHKIEKMEDCQKKGVMAWSMMKRTAESENRFQPRTGKVDGIPRKCFTKMLVYKQHCNSARSCIMTSYKYSLPRQRNSVPFNVENCPKDWSIETTCKANGPGGQHTKAVYSRCFNKGSRSFCGIEFQKCVPDTCYSWAVERSSCFSQCSMDTFDGVALKTRRTCQECGTTIQADISKCPGGENKAVKFGRCIRTPKSMKHPYCVTNETTTAQQSTVEVTTHSEILRTTAGTEGTTFASTTSKPTTKITADPTTPRSITSTTTVSTTPSTTRNRTKQQNDSPTTASSTTITEKEPETTTLITTGTAQGKTISRTTQQVESSTTKVKLILPPFLGNTPTANTDDQKSGDNPNSLQSGGHSRPRAEISFATLAGGVGAGVVFMVLVVLLVMVILKRTEANNSPKRSFSTSSLYKQKSTRNPVVDSSSFRVTTWQRERPPLPPELRISDSSESDKLGNSYWKIGAPSEDSYGGPVSPTDKDSLELPDVGNARKHEPVYDEVIEEECTNIYASIKDPRKEERIEANKARHLSSSSGQEVTSDMPTRPSRNQRPVYAVVNKSRKNASGSQKLFQVDDDEVPNPFRKPRGPRESTNSVTTLNERQLRDGVLQIEFDKKEGLRCKLSGSNVYINLEDTDPSPVF